MPFLASIAAALATPNARQFHLLKEGLLLVIVLVAAFGVTLAALVALASLRRGRLFRRSGPREVSASVLVNPWAEAGRRVEPATSIEGVPSSGAGTAAPREPIIVLPKRVPKVEPRLASRAIDGSRPVVVITGGARRVGAAIVSEFASCGCDIVFTYRSSERSAKELLRALAEAGIGAEGAQLDLGDLSDVQAWAAGLVARLPRVDVIVHNASVYSPTPISDLTAEEAMRFHAINAIAPLMLTKHLAPLMAESTLEGGGAVIAMVDIHAMGRPRRGYSAYSMSKASLVEMVYSLARELAPRIRVNGVAPGVVEWPESGSESQTAEQEAYVRRVPLRRAGTPEDAAKAARWLALEAPYVTGHIIRVDGGRFLA